MIMLLSLFSISQLILRIKAVLKRTLPKQSYQPFIIFDENRKVDVDNFCLVNGGNAQWFSKREIQLLEYLHQHNERPVPREELLAEIWGYSKEMEIETRTVDIHIARIRRKIEPFT